MKNLWTVVGAVGLAFVFSAILIFGIIFLVVNSDASQREELRDQLLKVQLATEHGAGPEQLSQLTFAASYYWHNHPDLQTGELRTRLNAFDDVVRQRDRDLSRDYHLAWLGCLEAQCLLDRTALLKQ